MDDLFLKIISGEEEGKNLPMRMNTVLLSMTSFLFNQDIS